MAAASSAAVENLLLLLLLCGPIAALNAWLEASRGTYRLASCGISHKLRLLLNCHLCTHSNMNVCIHT